MRAHADEHGFGTLGIIDPRTVTVTATGWLPYFDEVIVANPFINAGTVKPEFSPTKSPSKYKVQTLKNVLLLLVLEPFIDAGFVHMIPDLADFNDIRHVLMDLAEQRVGENMKLDDKDLERNRALFEDDMMRANRGLPDEALRGFIQPPGVERHGHEPRAPDFQRMKNRVGPDAIRVNLPARIEARVKARRGARGTEDADFVGQTGVDSRGPFCEGNAVARHVDMRDLSERMHPRIRAPRSVDDDARADNLRERFLQKILHPIPSRLALPAPEFPPVVGD